MRWAETAANVVELLAGYEKGESSPEFEAYCLAYRTSVMQREFQRELLRRLHKPRRELFNLNLRSPKVRAAMTRAGEAAEIPLPKYFDSVRRLLHSHLQNWLDCRKNTFSLMIERPELKQNIDKVLKAARPYVRWNRRGGPGEFQFPRITSFTLTTGRPEMEAARLFLIVLTSPDIELVKRCKNRRCRSIFFATRPDREYCKKPSCRWESKYGKDYKDKRKKHMAAIRKEDIDNVVALAAESKMEGAKLMAFLNARIAAKKAEHENALKRREKRERAPFSTIEEISPNWMDRHRDEIKRKKEEL
jgi:hypothetical protein